MKYPTVEQALEMLEEANKKNPGPWVDHSRTVAESAGAIAKKCAGMDAEAAFVLGLLHDIGRREGWSYIAHVLDGYRYLAGKGFDEAGAVCLTHSFPVKDVSVYSGEYDCTADDLEFLQGYLNARQYTDYDRLIQLCDSVSLPNGAVLMEKRLVDVALRYGVNDKTLEKWKVFFEIKKYFDEKTGCGIYSLLPGIERNTFEY